MSSIFDSLQKAQHERDQLARDEESAQTNTPAEKECESDAIELQTKTRSSNLFGGVFWLAVLLSVIVVGYFVFQHQANGVELTELLRRYFASI